MKTINEFNLQEKRVLIRVDFNVPLDEQCNITDDARIQAALPTIRYAIEHDAKVIIASHLGRPKGSPNPNFSLKPAALRLQQLLGRDVLMAPDCVGQTVAAMVNKMKPCDVIMLENLRFHPQEQNNDPAFAEQLAGLCDVYINDAFAVSHRENASVSAITGFVKNSGAGYLLNGELEYFSRAMENPERPLVAVVGGAKVSSKLKALENMLNRVDSLIIGGAMANTFLTANGMSLGKSRIEKDLLKTAESIMKRAADAGIKIYLPVDAVSADRFAADSQKMTTSVQEIPDEWMILDIGPESITLFSEVIRKAGTIIWNGPMGVFEMDAFSNGTLKMAEHIADSNALSIVGGGDTDAALHKSGKINRISYVSTGGGAFLALLEGKTLPGVKALE